MLVNGKAFEGTVDYEVTDGQLRTCTGNSHTSCITTFRPVVFPNAQMVYKLLLALHKYHLFCSLTRTFALVVAGRLDTFNGITILIVMTDHRSNPILCWLFQKVTAPNFAIENDFKFTLVNGDDAPLDLFHYAVSYEGVTLHVSILGIDTTEHCGPQSNIDVVYFVREIFLRFS